MSRKILVVYAKGNEELRNRKAALGSYIVSLSQLLRKGKQEVFINGAEIHNFEKPLNINISSNSRRTVFSKLFPKFLKEIINDFLRFKKIAQLSRSIKSNCIKPDFIIEFYSFSSGLGKELAIYYKVPLIIIYDAPVLEEYEYFNGRKRFFRHKIQLLEKQSLEFASHVVLYSEAVLEYLRVKKIGISKFSFHQNIDFSRFDFLPPSELSYPITIGFLGSFLKWHRCDELVFAFRNLVQKGYDLRLFLIGDGLEFEAVKELVKINKLDDLVYMPGFLDSDELIRIKSQIHIGVMPGSNWYGAPNKIFEYGASGMAVICPQTPTIKSIFPADVPLLMFNQEEKFALEEEIEKIVANPEAIKPLAIAFQKFIKNQYHLDYTLNHYLKIFQEFE